MCDVEKEINIGCVEDNEAFQENISHSFETELKDSPEILAYIQRLQDCIFRQRRIIVKLYEKIKNEDKNNKQKQERKSVCDASTQSYDSDFTWETQECTQQTESGESIVDQVKEIAESAVRQTGFVYEKNSGMYYDYNTGYYYNAELGLYYDGNNGVYYSYDETTKTFNYHSSIDGSVVQKTSSNEPVKRKDDVVGNEELDNQIKRPKSNDSESKIKEEGECSDDNNENDDSKSDDNLKQIFSDNSSKTDLNFVVVPSLLNDLNTDIDLDELACGWPPCMRVVVQETGLDNLNIGTLFIVTCSGGTLGREGNHSVTIPDIMISKHHASFKFSEESKRYTIVDLGSRNGTFLNGNRLSVALQESPPHPIEHGSVLRVGSTHLLCHIHDGRQTCRQCEPGCMSPVKPDKGEALNESRQVRHRSELRRLRRRFGLEGPGSAIRVPSNDSANYQDRAEARRKTVGSSNDHEKTDSASVFQSIKSDNKGFKMMSKMGWTEGQTLGKDSNSENAITEPIFVEQRPDKAGLGCSESTISTSEVRPSAKQKNTIWKKTQKRYKELSQE